MTSQTLSEFQRRKIMHRFELLDIDKNGTIEFVDFQRVVVGLAQARDYQPGDASYNQLLETNRDLWTALQKYADADDDGSITPEEWLAYHTEALLQARDFRELIPGFETTIEAFTSFIHHLLDADGDGKVTEEDYLELSRAQGIDDVESLRIFDGIDKDRDGTLTLDEVSDLVREFYLSDDPEAVGNAFFGYLHN